MRLSKSAIRAELAKVPGWSSSGNSIRRKFTFASFPDAIAYVTRLAFDAQEADHHPDILINYKRVTVTWSTHDAGGVTRKDFKGARQADAVARTFGIAGAA